jgi:uncharacterized membrane protein
VASIGQHYNKIKQFQKRLNMERNKIKLFFKNYWWTIVLGLTILISVVVSIQTIIFYWKQFHETQISNNPDNWGVFGDYLGGTLNPLLSIINICITVWLTIIINKYANKNTDRQIDSAIKIAQIDLKHQALKELRDELNLNFNTWRQANNIPTNAQN